MTRTWSHCPDCGFDLFLPICELSVTALGLYDDDRYPGRCILAYKPHREHLDALDRDELLAFMLDVQRASRAIRAVTGADRVNTAVLGNAVPHLHAHLVPRVRGGDPVPKQSPWDHPRDAAPIEAGARQSLMRAIANALARVAE